ncbi:MAG: hypothetical protein OCC49_01145 [Fibrobacterales bacterium]
MVSIKLLIRCTIVVAVCSGILFAGAYKKPEGWIKNKNPREEVFKQFIAPSSQGYSANITVRKIERKKKQRDQKFRLILDDYIKKQSKRKSQYTMLVKRKDKIGGNKGVWWKFSHVNKSTGQKIIQLNFAIKDRKDFILLSLECSKQDLKLFRKTFKSFLNDVKIK